MAPELSMEIRNEALKRAMRDPNLVAGPVKDFLSKATLTVEAKAKEFAPVDTGRLRSSIESAINPPIGIVRTAVTYAPHIEYGTRPHEIRPVRKKALAFNIGGERIVVRRVMHPGTRPRPFMRPALERSKVRIEELLREATAAIERRWSRG